LPQRENRLVSRRTIADGARQTRPGRLIRATPSRRLAVHRSGTQLRHNHHVAFYAANRLRETDSDYNGRPVTNQSLKDADPG